MKTNVVQEKSYEFALRVIKMYQHLVESKREFVLSKQALRSGTSIGANVEEAVGAQSPNDFIAKLSIAYKEARETHYWLRLLHDSGYLSDKESCSILHDCSELLKLLSSILQTMKQRNNA